MSSEDDGGLLLLLLLVVLVLKALVVKDGGCCCCCCDRGLPAADPDSKTRGPTRETDRRKIRLILCDAVLGVLTKKSPSVVVVVEVPALILLL